MAITVATLDGADLPLGFSYDPYIPKKRYSITETAKAVITQSAAPDVIVEGDGIVTWRLPGAYPSEFQTFFDLYDTTDLAIYDFVGYWGETLEVLFLKFSAPRVRGGYFNLSGVFQVVQTTSSYVAVCTK